MRLVRMLPVAVLLISGAPFAAAAPPPAPAAAPASPADIAPDPALWQDVITGQIEAFRKGDAPTAFSYAATAFQKSFTDPAVFMVSIAASGYTPIFTSVSHSFGKFTLIDATTVVQVVHLVGPKQELYEAAYALGKEDGGWRVQGVQLAKVDGLAV
jgi:hypothetical protein